MSASRAGRDDTSGSDNPACSSRMIVPCRPDASSPGPRGPAESSPRGGSRRKAALTGPDMWPSCQRISSATATCWSGAADPAALAAYAAAPGRSRPYGRRPRPAPRLRRPRPLRQTAGHERRPHRRTAGGSPRRHQARRERRLASWRCVRRASILWCLRLEHPQHPLGAVCCPRRDDPPVALAECLRRTHGNIVAAYRDTSTVPRRSCRDVLCRGARQ